MCVGGGGGVDPVVGEDFAQEENCQGVGGVGMLRIRFSSKGRAAQEIYILLHTASTKTGEEDLA